MNRKIKALIIFNHLAAIVALTYGNPWMLFGSFIAFVFINKLGGEIGLHRYFCHRSFSTSKFWHYTMLIAASLNCFGPPMAWVGVHRKHHVASDTSDDPHGKQSAWRIWLTVWKPFQVDMKYIKDMLKDKDQLFVYKYYFWLISTVWLSLFFINWQLPIFLISLPSVISFHLAGLVNTVCHITGDRLYETKDTSYNNKWVNMLTLGSGLHNTHHAFPTSWDNRRNLNDIDLPAIIIKNILLKE
jgi:stearoyl-CoA desaturase (delta-9 desaturase)